MNNIIKEILSLSENGEKIMKAKTILIDKAKTKEIDLMEILDKVNNRELEVGEVIKVKGFLSRYAPIIEPETYHNQVYKFTSKKEFNKRTKLFEVVDYISVLECSPPVMCSNFSDNNIVAYLYLNEDKDMFNFESKDGKTLSVNDKNKYIPIVLSLEDYSRLIGNFIEIECVINVIKFNDKNFLFLTDGYDEIISLFHDKWNENVDTIFLKLKSINKIIKNDKFECLNINFAVEYSFESNVLDSDELIDMVNIALSKIKIERKLKALGQRMAKKNISCLLSKDDIYVNMYNNKVGFYTVLDIKNSDQYKNKLKKLQTRINKFIGELDYRIKSSITFISDIRKIEIFDNK